MIETLLISLSLSADSFAASLSGGGKTPSKFFNALKIALFFGLFQALMPIVGWLIGSNLKDFISNIDHWIAFLLLSIIGGSMIYEALKKKKEGKKINLLDFHVLIALSIATSIDALIVGIGFAFVEINIIPTVITIGIITFLLSFIGFFIGNNLGKFFKKYVEIFGGIILIGIGIKILLTHIL